MPKKNPSMLDTAKAVGGKQGVPTLLNTALLSLGELADDRAYGFADAFSESARGVTEVRSALALVKALAHDIEANLEDALSNQITYHKEKLAEYKQVQT